MASFEELTDQQHNAFKSSLRHGQYSLLLGSGISLDTTNARGVLPSAEALRRDLCTVKGAGPNTTLQRVFALLTEDEVASLVTDPFSDCSVGPSVSGLTSFVWKRIFTFNIDDAVENAYESDDPMQRLKSLNFTDTYEEVGQLTELPIVHLHGFVKRASEGYVFSIQEYVRFMQETNPWMVVLAQQMLAEPFVLIGTSLNEPDMEYYLSLRRPSSQRSDRGPSIFVSPDPDAVTQHDCDRFGLTLFHGTCLEFLDYCREHAPAVTPQQLVPQEQRRLLTSDIDELKRGSFWADFELVPGVVETIDDTTVPRFLYGHPPTWNDLSANLDIARSTTASIIARAQQPSGDPDARLLVIFDNPGAGKTTLLNRVATELSRTGRAVLQCTSLSRLEPLATVEVLNALRKSPVIVVDDFAAQATQVASILDHSEIRRDLIVIGAERSYRQRYVEEALSGVQFSKLNCGKLSSDDVSALIERYSRFGILGRRDALSEQSGLPRQLIRDPIAVACCRILNDFRSLDRIVQDVFSDSNQIDQRRFVVAALAQFCFPAGVRYDVLSSITNAKGFAQQLKLGHPLPLAFTTNEMVSFIAPENATVGTRVLLHCAKQDPAMILETFVGLASAIAPRVNPKTIMQRSPEARLAGRLFDVDGPVRRFLGTSHAPEFYRRTRDAWQWNSRYWGQCALLELERFHADPRSSDGIYALDLAVQHARHAVTIERHHIPLTTLGQTLLTQMSVEGPAAMNECYTEAFNALHEAIENERNKVRMAVQPLVVLFRGTAEFAAAGGKLSTNQVTWLQSLVDDARHRLRRDARLAEVLDNLTATGAAIV